MVSTSGERDCVPGSSVMFLFRGARNDEHMVMGTRRPFSLAMRQIKCVIRMASCDNVPPSSSSSSEPWSQLQTSLASCGRCAASYKKQPRKVVVMSWLCPAAVIRGNSCIQAWPDVFSCRRGAACRGRGQQTSVVKRVRTDLVPRTESESERAKRRFESLCNRHHLLTCLLPNVDEHLQFRVCCV